jgi:hypothetical protein
MKIFFEWLDTATFPVWQGLLFAVGVLVLIFSRAIYGLYKKYVVKGKK